MSKKLGTKFAGLAFAALCAGALLAPAAQATPIVFSNTGTSTGTSRFTIGCGSASGSCAGKLEAVDVTSPLTWSSSFGLMLAGPSPSPANETTFINSLLGMTTLTATSGNISPSGSGDSVIFSTDAQFFLVKVGNTSASQPYAVLQNIHGGTLNLFFQASPAGGGGLSHYITFAGGTTTVPEPGTLGMLGLGLLIVGLGYGLRRRTS